MRREIFTGLSTLLLACACWATLLGCASGSAAPVTENPRASWRMTWERIHLKLESDGWVTTVVVYRFEGAGASPAKLAFPETEWFELVGFQSEYDGVRLLTHKELPPPGHYFAVNGLRLPAIHVSPLPISSVAISGAAHRLRDQYRFLPPFYQPGSKSGRNGPVGRYLEYILVTGATWRGPIGRVEVVVETGLTCERIVALEDSLPGQCHEGVWGFVAEEMEPRHNIRLVLTDPPYTQAE